jgi:hypothetical protein
MSRHKEREEYFVTVVEKLQFSHLVEGTIQLGSPLPNCKGEYSDINLMCFM